MHVYNTFGLEIQSDFPLPELMPSKGGSSDVSIRVRSVDWTPPGDEEPDSCHQIGEDEAYLFWRQVGVFAVYRGEEVWIDPRPGVPESLVRLPLLGAVLGILLHQRGRIVLHAGSVSMYGGAVAFIGHKGCGKSTTVGTLHARGHRVVTDDHLAIELDVDRGAMVTPGFPRLKLWPDAAASIGIEQQRLSPLADGIPKVNQDVTDGFERSELPLRCIYVLDGGPALSIEPVSKIDAFIELLRHTRHLSLTEDDRSATLLGPLYARLVGTVPIRRLRRTVSLPDLPDVASAVEQDVRQLASSFVEA